MVKMFVPKRFEHMGFATDDNVFHNGTALWAVDMGQPRRHVDQFLTKFATRGTLEVM